MVADYPTAYRSHPALPVLAGIPTTWDDTCVLDAEAGEFIVIARRSGTNWYVGAMTDRKARELRIRLGFLGDGEYQATVYSANLSAKLEIAIRSEAVTAGSSVILKQVGAGGGMVRLTR